MNYRNDIDGLRAIAVIGVILYHFGATGISGGFVGVDVFFVLSGYLIGNIIFTQLEKKQFSLSNFYFRRVRRLFPVYVFVMLVTFFIAYGVMLPGDFREFGQSIFTSSIYLSNVLFYLEAGYFDSASNLKPLLHTWSLSIEEQFYLIFPLLAYVISKFSKFWVICVFSMLTLTSFIASIVYIDFDETAVFYLYPFRAWELFLGVVLALKVMPKVQNKVIGSFIANIGFAMILIPYIAYDGTTKFPGFSALLPCLGTIFVIYTGISNSHFIHRLLSTKTLSFIGKISYSLYLWHWPIYVFYTYDKQNELSFLNSMGMILLTFFLSVISWKYIEIPFREGRVAFSKTKFSVFLSTSAVTLVFLLVGFYIHHTDGMPSRLSKEQLEFSNISLFGQIPNCAEHDNNTYPNIRHCLIGNPQRGDDYTLIWGDSHGGAFAQGIMKAFKREGRSALLAWSGGCPTLFDITKKESASTNREDSQCAIQNAAIKELIKTESEKINAILLIGRWSYYLNGRGYGDDYHNIISITSNLMIELNDLDSSKRFMELFKATLTEINNSKINVFVLEQVPEFKQFDSRHYAIQMLNGRMSKENIIEKFSYDDYENTLLRQGGFVKFLSTLDKSGLSTTIQTHQYFCNEDKCSSFINGVPMYFDNNHISTIGSMQMYDIFDPLLEYIDQSSARN